MIYYSNHYLQFQNYANLEKIENDFFFICFEKHETRAISIPFAPFGGIVIKQPNTEKQLDQFLEVLYNSLKNQSINQLIIHQPPAFYKGFVCSDILFNRGYGLFQKEIGQAIELSSINLHPMQKRILDKPSNFEWVVNQDFSAAHDFIAHCRVAQGLTINISKDKLLSLSYKLENEYSVHWIYENGKTPAACLILVKATADIAYYYLPATNPDFKKKSPMVFLMWHLYQNLKEDKFRILDLGKSSVGGVRQEGLYQFKEKMGGFETDYLSLVTQI